jgi:hypothetical protein
MFLAGTNLSAVQAFALEQAGRIVDDAFPGTDFRFDEERQEYLIVIPDLGHKYLHPTKPLRAVPEAA